MLSCVPPGPRTVPSHGWSPSPAVPAAPAARSAWRRRSASPGAAGGIRPRSRLACQRPKSAVLLGWKKCTWYIIILYMYSHTYIYIYICMYVGGKVIYIYTYMCNHIIHIWYIYIYIYVCTRLVYGLVWVALDWICFARASRGFALDRIGLDA